MGSLAINSAPLAVGAHCTEDELVITLTDGRTLSTPLVWFPRLAKASPKQRGNIEILGAGEGIHWPDVDEDISVIGLLEGRASIEYLVQA